MSYYEVVVKQLIADNADKFELVYNPGQKNQIILPVEYFALCDLKEKPCVQDKYKSNARYCDVILPVVFDGDEGLQPEITSYYKNDDQQEVRLRKKRLDN